MHFPLLVLATSFASLHCASGFVLSGSSARGRGSASSEFQRTYTRGIRSSSNTNTAMKRRTTSGRGSSPLASDRLTVGREHRVFSLVRVFGACFCGVAWRRCTQHSSCMVQSMIHDTVHALLRKPYRADDYWIKHRFRAIWCGPCVVPLL